MLASVKSLNSMSLQLQGMDLLSKDISEMRDQLNLYGEKYMKQCNYVMYPQLKKASHQQKMMKM